MARSGMGGEPRRVPLATRARKRALARILASGYLVAITSLSLLRDDLSLRDDEISKLLTGPHHAEARAAFVLLAVSSGLLADAVAEESPRPVSYLLLAYAVSVLTAGLTTPSQATHNAASLVAFAVIPIAMYLHASGRPSAYAWVAGVILSLGSWPLLGFGLGERLTVYLEIAWLIGLDPSRRADAGA